MQKPPQYTTQKKYTSLNGAPDQMKLPPVCGCDLEVSLHMFGLDVEGVRPRLWPAQLRQLLLLLLLLMPRRTVLAAAATCRWLLLLAAHVPRTLAAAVCGM
jgi:hypothetical protein